MLQGGASTSRQAKVEAISIGSASSGTRTSRKLSLISTAPSLKFPNTVQGKNYVVGCICGTRALHTHQFSSELLTRCIKKLRNTRAIQMVSQLIFQQLSPPQLAQPAQDITSMFTSLDFEIQWTTVVETLVPKKLFPSKLSEFRPFSSLSTMRKLLGYVWLEAMGYTQFHSFQTGFLRKTDASHGVSVLERASELAKEWRTPLFLAQLDLKKAFGHILLRNHSAATNCCIRAVALGTQHVVEPERRCSQLDGDHQ